MSNTIAEKLTINQKAVIDENAGKDNQPDQGNKRTITMRVSFNCQSQETSSVFKAINFSRQRESEFYKKVNEALGGV